MPELPEVETSKRYLKQFLLNAKIINVKLNVPKLRWKINPEIKNIFNNTRILKIDRIGKYIIINASNKKTLIIHLGMSGYLSINEVNFKKIKHDHIIINFQGINGEKKSLIYNDQRRFGYIDFHHTSSLKKHFLIKNLGIDGLSKNLKYDFLSKIFFNKNTIIKSTLLDQKIICGIGNIYASEILFHSKIYPLKKVNHLNEYEINSLLLNINTVLSKAVLNGGTTIKDYKQPDGKVGYFKQKLKVYGREKLKCYDCSNIILKLNINKRATYICPECQKNQNTN